MGDVRVEEETEGCLMAGMVNGNIKFPQKNIMVCKFCPLRSTDVGDMSKTCLLPAVE